MRPDTSGQINRQPHQARWNARKLRGREVDSASSPNQNDLLVWSQTRSVWTPQAALGGAYEAPTLSNSSSDAANSIVISAGRALMTLGSRGTVVLAAALSKQLNNTWTPGTGLGGRFAGVTLADQTYHVFLLWNELTGQVDAGFDTSPVAANRPSGWSARRLGSIMRRSGSISSFVQLGWKFLQTPTIDLNNVSIATIAVNYVLSVPKGISVEAKFIFAGGLAQGDLEITVQTPLLPLQTPGGLANNALRGAYGSIYQTLSDGASTFDWAYSMAMSVITDTNASVLMQRAGTYKSVNGSSLQTTGWDDFLLLTGQ